MRSELRADLTHSRRKQTLSLLCHRGGSSEAKDESCLMSPFDSNDQKRERGGGGGGRGGWGVGSNLHHDHANDEALRRWCWESRLTSRHSGKSNPQPPSWPTGEKPLGLLRNRARTQVKHDRSCSAFSAAVPHTRVGSTTPLFVKQLKQWTSHAMVQRLTPL